jgi:hypothetical protein
MPQEDEEEEEKEELEEEEDEEEEKKKEERKEDTTDNSSGKDFGNNLSAIFRKIHVHKIVLTVWKMLYFGVLFQLHPGLS